MGTAVLETIVNEALTVLLKRGKRVLCMIKEAVSCDNASSHHPPETHMWLNDPVSRFAVTILRAQNPFLH